MCDLLSFDFMYAVILVYSTIVIFEREKLVISVVFNEKYEVLVMTDEYKIGTI